MQERFIKKWLSDLNSNDKLRTYRKFKSTFCLENYLIHIKNVQDRFSLARLRTSSHKLHIETGRFTIPKTDVASRICSHCNLNCIEDEEHFILVCPKYSILRDKYIKPVVDSDILRSLSNSDLLVWLMSNEDKYVCRRLASYSNNSFQLRIS